MRPIRLIGPIKDQSDRSYQTDPTDPTDQADQTNQRSLSEYRRVCSV